MKIYFCIKKEGNLTLFEIEKQQKVRSTSNKN